MREPFKASIFNRAERQQSDVAGAFDRNRKGALVLRAGAGNPTRRNFASLGDELSQHSVIFKIDLQFFVRAKATDLAPDHHAPPTRSSVFVRTFALHSRTSVFFSHLTILQIFFPFFAGGCYALRR